MTATYFRHGEGRSIAARVAESDGRMPMSRAKVTVASEHGCTQVVAAAALTLLHDGEWHHVGKYATRCDYFGTADARLGGAIAHIMACGGAAKFRVRREAMRAARRYPNGPYSTHRHVGRILELQARRRAAIATAHEALGREPIGPFQAWNYGNLRPKNWTGTVDQRAVELAEQMYLPSQIRGILGIE